MKQKCPCCGMGTLTTRYEYEICSLCGWEDDGTPEKKYSLANGGTIRQYQVWALTNNVTIKNRSVK